MSQSIDRACAFEAFEIVQNDSIDFHIRKLTIPKVLLIMVLLYLSTIPLNCRSEKHPIQTAS